MKENIAWLYHEQTKHYYNRYAKSLGFLDWANQPNPYRTYELTQKFPLSLGWKNNVSYNELFCDKPPCELGYETLSAFFRYGFGLACKKRFGASNWELRINASSGNFHPGEAYAIVPSLKGLAETMSLYHYHSFTHFLEQLSCVDIELEEGSVVVFLSSVIYREMWKYGERDATGIRCLILGISIAVWNSADIFLDGRSLL